MRHFLTPLMLCLMIPARSAWGEENFICTGSSPDWALTVDSATAEFRFPSPTTMEVLLNTKAEGVEWPRALTLIGDRDTAIVVIEQESCEDAKPYRAHVMTQRGQTPILLTGCCTVPE